MRYWTNEFQPEIEDLRQRLDAFYAAEENHYSAFETVSNQSLYWDKVVARISEMLAQLPDGNKLRVLEFGAGCTGFPAVLQTVRSRVIYSVQDVTSRNRDYLAGISDRVHVGDLSSMGGVYDVIFSTFVWEHITNPRVTLDILIESLAPGGSLFLFSPRYDIPGYVPPALRHMGKLRALSLSIWLALTRLEPSLGGKAHFWIVRDPALFHSATWFRDADAVHLVSRHDLFAHLGKRDVSIIDCWPKKPNFLSTLLEKRIKLCVEVRKA